MTNDGSAVSPSAATGGRDHESPVVGHVNNSTYAGLPLNPDGIPDALKKYSQFVAYRLVGKAGKPGKRDKVPYQPHHPTRKASTKDPDHWGSFAKALEVYSSGDAHGIGFVLTGLDSIVAIDLDGCINTGGKLSETALEIINSLHGYWERSPSGRGLHGIFKGSLPGPDIANHESGVEIYGGCQPRYITLTGQTWGDGMVNTLKVAPPNALKRIYEAHKPRQSTPDRDIPQPDLLPEDELPIIDGRVSADALRELREGIIADDRSRRLTAISHELFDSGFNDQQVFSILVDSHGAMDVALAHRNQNQNKAIDYLWQHIALKTTGSYRDPKEMFEDLDAVIDIDEIDKRFIAKTISNVDVSAIPPRPWILANRIMSGAVTAILATGGVGKSVYAIVTGIAICLDKEITGENIRRSKCVWIINNEDDEYELHRRVAATCHRFNIPPELLEGRLYINSGADIPWQVARRTVEGKEIVKTKIVNYIIEQIRNLDIGVLIVDPFVSTHTASENSNDEIQQVINIYKRIAAETGCAVVIVHHTSKSGGDTEAHAGNAESARGASALINACRFAFTLARMSQKTADDLGIDKEERRRMVRIDSAKANYALPDKQATWFRLDTVELPNGDHVGVPVPFDLNTIAAILNQAKEQEKVERRQGYLDDIAEALDELGGMRVTRRSTVERLRRMWGVSETAARGRVDGILPVRSESPGFIPAEGRTMTNGRWHMWLEKHPTNPTAAVSVYREQITEEQSPSAPRGTDTNSSNSAGSADDG
ncbi:MAG: AAA family ATPase [Candidatus Thiodiazotropha endolucinida]